MAAVALSAGPLLGAIESYLLEIWPIIVAGIVVFALWGLAKTAARHSGARLGMVGIGLVLVSLAAASWFLLGLASWAFVLGIIGILVLALGLVRGPS